MKRLEPGAYNSSCSLVPSEAALKEEASLDFLAFYHGIRPETETTSRGHSPLLTQPQGLCLPSQLSSYCHPPNPWMLGSLNTNS